MAHPERQGGKLDVGVAAGGVFPRSGQFERDTASFEAGVAREGFYGDFGGAATGHIAV